MSAESRNRKNRWLTGLYAALLPGGGHLYLGWYGRGLLLLLVVLLDLAALIRFSDSTSGSRALLLLYLGYALPALYFYSVFDALEIHSRSKLAAGSRGGGAGPFSIRHSLVLVGGGLLLLFLIRPTEAVQPRLDWIGDMASGAVLLALAAWLSLRRSPEQFRFGRLSAILLLAACGAILLWDQIRERNDIGLLSEWWPVLFVLAGAEMLLFQLLERRRPGRRLTIGAGAAAAAVLLIGSAYAVTQYGGLPFRWLDQYAGRTSLENLSEEKGFHFEQEPIFLALEGQVASVIIDNPNGDVTVRAASDPSSRQVTVQAELWVDTEDSKEADHVREKSKLKVSSEGKLEIAAQGMPYGANGSRLPRYNLIVTMPADLEASFRSDETAPLPMLPLPSMPSGLFSPSPSSVPTNVAAQSADRSSAGSSASAVSSVATAGPSMLPSPSAEPEASPSPSPSASPTPGPEAVKLLLHAGNGNVSMSGLTAEGGLTVKNGNGAIELRDLRGKVEADTTSGNITAERIAGDAALSARDGSIQASRIDGSINAYTSNGNLEISEIEGDSAILETKNGFIRVEEVAGSLQADTLNGEIRIRSSTVGGGWDIDSSIGEVMLSLPTTSSYVMDGAVTFGEIRTELPLQVTKKRVEGTIGLGIHRIRVDANSDISIFAYPSMPE
ncbi:DUF4097 domain-containing protein [Paenibacillus albicereus]|uniref:DUF4097 domain-containing protein n=1 Tax=Paenibacillus albicereus TaxID=2726185 RepID=A0A6H2GUY6_9BACL|nr:DUF4097 family beta strand repeat-containing protein [Paenibacillus albicereus]QJC51217.1 DUF4097 domain-containing protein [Paenibacillus albicereus]